MGLIEIHFIHHEGSPKTGSSWGGGGNEALPTKAPDTSKERSTFADKPTLGNMRSDLAGCLYPAGLAACDGSD